MTIQHRDGTVEFRFYRGQAGQVFLLGDFTDWDARKVLMKPDGDGWWLCRVRLGPGVYQFQYDAEGQRFLDYAAFGLELGPFGWNSVVYVAGLDRRSSSGPSAGGIGSGSRIGTSARGPASRQTADRSSKDLTLV
ncbi:MAG TPA: hypothetical protein PKY77_23820 [Phycisphaerae bacterium]|nr:hypothetical protein [Phycisphaerae bacterium]HRY71341.1 hypothetical protein [Phycisphaerae bacterium]HSA29795.1 hypothetical protein [Phycisphaerae bacterium]